MTDEWIFATTPFDALDQDWEAICRRNRRAGLLANWASQEPDLAHIQDLDEIIPPKHVDRTSRCAAVARLHIAGDDLAGRTLLQLLVPGLVVLTARWRHRIPGGVTEACWEVITRATIYIGQLRERQIRCSVAGYVLRSVERDLVIDAEEQTVQEAELAAAWEDHDDYDIGLAVPSPEDAICVSTAVQTGLEEAARRCRLPAESVETLRLVFAGYAVPQAAAMTGQPAATAYRHRDQILTHLRSQLLADES